MHDPDAIVTKMLDGHLAPMRQAMANKVDQPPIKLTIDGREVAVPRVTLSFDSAGKPVPRYSTLYDAADKLDIKIPILCHRDYMTPVAVCQIGRASCRERV